MTTILLLLGITDYGLTASIRIAPHRFIFRADQPLTEEVHIFNSSNQPVRVRVTTDLADGQNEEEYLGDWIVIYPPLLNIEPGQQRVVRFSIRPPEEEIEDGEYRSLLFFEELPLIEDQEEETEEVNQEEGELEIDFRLLYKIGINLYGQFGEINYQGYPEELNAFTEERDIYDDQGEYLETKNILIIKGNFINQGNAHLRMNTEISIYDKLQQLVKETDTRLVVHRSDQNHIYTEIEIEEQLQEGQINVKFIQEQVIEDMNEKIISEEIILF